MKTETMDILEFDKLLTDCNQENRKQIIDYISYLHDKIANFDMINDFVVDNIQKRYPRKPIDLFFK